MSEAMAQKKMEDIKNFEKVEQAILEEVKKDTCPACGLPTAKLAYLNENIIKMFGWVECTRCGCVYSPESIRQQKAILARSGMLPVNPGQSIIATA